MNNKPVGTEARGKNGIIYPRTEFFEKAGRSHPLAFASSLPLCQELRTKENYLTNF